ncbi:hypothetical protein ACFVTX_18125 [Agromyces sp. NPDC058136]|uniref:hypothetical protein n=1 Tax=Agromyces sp. NPDC058136 TaxID=3346354 RepID=UPI0036D8B206
MPITEAGARITAERLAEILAEATGTYTDEYDLQVALDARLTTALAGTGRDVMREVRLSDGVSRADIWVDGTRWLGPGVVVEVKVAGSLASVVRQLERYAACVEVGELILVTTRARHHHVPREIAGKRVHLVSLVEGGL